MEGYYNQTEIKELGFTNKMIKELLPEPQLKQNPKYRSAAPMKLWPCELVESVMESCEYKALKKKLDNRMAGAMKAVETKRKSLENDIDNAIKSIRVLKISDEELLEETLTAKQEWYEYNAIERGIDAKCTVDADQKTIDRWKVNYIRHNLTSYDSHLYDIKGRVGAAYEYERYRHAVLDAIAQSYPTLANECRRQKGERQ